MAIDEQPIGMATMMEDGTIVLDLRAEVPGGGRGIGRLTYPPSHPQYPEVLSHLGGLRPGEQKLVPPWGDEEITAETLPEPPPPTSIRCSSCGTANPPGSRFCNQCGAALGCPSCGANNPPGSRFCNRCGASLRGGSP